MGRKTTWKYQIAALMWFLVQRIRGDVRRQVALRFFGGRELGSRRMPAYQLPKRLPAVELEAADALCAAVRSDSADEICCECGSAAKVQYEITLTIPVRLQQQLRTVLVDACDGVVQDRCALEAAVSVSTSVKPLGVDLPRGKHATLGGHVVEVAISGQPRRIYAHFLHQI